MIMKKKILGAVLIAAMAVATSWNFNQSKNEMEFSDLALANIEALANNEGSSSMCVPMIGATCSYTEGGQTYTLYDYIEI